MTPEERAALDSRLAAAADATEIEKQGVVQYERKGNLPGSAVEVV